MINVYFATKARGFLRHFFNINIENSYEINKKKNIILSKLAKNKFISKFGYFKIIKIENKDCDIYGSYNRFLKANKNYFIYLENPTALYHYSLFCGKSILGKKRIKKCLLDPKLKAIICMSNACKNTFIELCGDYNGYLTQIYPYVPDNKMVNEINIKNRCNENNLKILFIAQGERFVSKGGLEVIEAYKRLKEKNENKKTSLTIVTSIHDISNKLTNQILEDKDISFINFDLSFSEMEKLYANHHILVQPSSDDSFGLTIIEAMKAGLAIISSKLYAFPEMVEDGINGYLIEPKYWLFDKNNMPNPLVWNNRKKTIYNENLSEQLIISIYEKMRLLQNNNLILQNMSISSYKKATQGKLCFEYIQNQWQQVYEVVK